MTVKKRKTAYRALSDRESAKCHHIHEHAD